MLSLFIRVEYIHLTSLAINNAHDYISKAVVLSLKLTVPEFATIGDFLNVFIQVEMSLFILFISYTFAKRFSAKTFSFIILPAFRVRLYVYACLV